MKNNIISIISVALLILLLGSTITSCGRKRGKIRLRARDTTALNLSGRWVLTDSAVAKMNRIKSEEGVYRITGMTLNRDHSASLYFKDSVTGGHGIQARWKKKEPMLNEAPADRKEGIFILIQKNTKTDTVGMGILDNPATGDTTLFIPGLFSYKKDR